MHWRGQAGYQQSWLTIGSSKKLFLGGFFPPQIQVFLILLYNLYNIFKYFICYSK
jgi:hypothetical protein